MSTAKDERPSSSFCSTEEKEKIVKKMMKKRRNSKNTMPKTYYVQPSPLLERVKAFLPQLEAANSKMVLNSADIVIEDLEDSDDDSLDETNYSVTKDSSNDSVCPMDDIDKKEDSEVLNVGGEKCSEELRRKDDSPGKAEEHVQSLSETEKTASPKEDLSGSPLIEMTLAVVPEMMNIMQEEEVEVENICANCETVDQGSDGDDFGTQVTEENIRLPTMKKTSKTLITEI